MTSSPSLLRGCFRILMLYDIAEAIDLAKVRELLGERAGSRASAFPRRTPEYVRFSHPPVVEAREPLTLQTGETFTCTIKYHAFAVVAVEIEAPFACGWSDLLAQASRWIDPDEFEAPARAMAGEHLQRITPAIVNLHKDWLEETYLVINLQDTGLQDTGLRDAGQPCDEHPTAEELLESCGGDIVRLIRGETAPLAAKSVAESLEGSLSYYPSDLIVVGASAALVYDRGEDAAAATQVLEFAKMQLLEFRYYDNLMSELLSDVYNLLDRKRSFALSRWHLPNEAQRINAIRLDVMDLTERVDNAIKFFSDAYYARVYRLAATRIGVPDYRDLVDEKLRTAGELYDFMMDQFNETRSFILDFAIALLCALDVILLFKH